MRVTLLLTSLMIAACASQPTGTAPSRLSAAPASAPEQSASQADVERTRLAEAIKRGYKVVNSNGEVLYCRSDWATGSHIQKNTVCLTGQDLDELHNRNDQLLDVPARSPFTKLP